MDMKKTSLGMGMTMNLIKFVSMIMTVSLVGCAAPGRHSSTLDDINGELDKAVAVKPKQETPKAVTQALMPPLNIEMPSASGKSLEQKFDLVVNNAPANQVFMGIVSGTRYSMLVHPGVTGTISVNLKDVTVFEALDVIRELYGYDYKVEGSRIYIEPLSMQTRVFHVNYLTSLRKGTSDIRVISGSVGDSVSGSSTTGGATTTTSGGGTKSVESSRISTTSESDFWGELTASLKAIVGTEGGRNVIVSPQSGIVVIRAMPQEMRSVETYLKATQIAVDRQVILEAKILEVQLSDGYQTGINWAALTNQQSHRFSVGADTSKFGLPGGAVTSGSTLGGVLGSGITEAAGRSAAGIFGLAFQTNSFTAMIQFLESQGNVHVLSSPRIATLNNQKAVLKVGTDEFFVTNVSTTTTTGTTSTTTPSVTLQPFFSGISLDVTPQIDENNNIILHIHPSVSDVTTKNKTVDLGTSGTLNLPLASSTVSETDSIVRAQDGQIVAIGGLMKRSLTADRNQVPGLGDVPVVGGLFSNSNRSAVKQELVILLKPTVVTGADTWTKNIIESQRNFRSLERPAASQAQ